ncbi:MULTISPECIES: hypothetical protein [unclassified Bradyrhizobium]|uniref:hypothetical protein n=1 Tax=unclassified Bradyrhizobium TaxID=2631580 RepID=UPI002478A3FF|nr:MULTISPECIES: hypothetical protein [unclassified Bradyrhizobium]WGR68612.1 hypothetical protein MTX24_24630 [Bradyrhizobium sp. ISRA426]WGR80667.1 hypothetical protein MTX21_09745 [Bradyrhizobium sp. ISRA430]WGR83852.1 hypothetical protein MTX25_24310 [Bradyrhizobium sp. ISRA432]
MPVEKAPPASRFKKFVLKLDYRDGAMNGFGACQDAGDAFLYHATPAGLDENHVFDVDGAVVKQLDRKTPAMQRPQFVFERDEAVFAYESQGF